MILSSWVGGLKHNFVLISWGLCCLTSLSQSLVLHCLPFKEKNCVLGALIPYLLQVLAQLSLQATQSTFLNISATFTHSQLSLIPTLIYFSPVCRTQILTFSQVYGPLLLGCKLQKAEVLFCSMVHTLWSEHCLA